MIFNARRARTEQLPLFADYPVPVRRVFIWFDELTDRQRVQYAVGAILFLVACAGYLLGLGSTIVLRRLETEDAALVEDHPATLKA